MLVDAEIDGYKSDTLPLLFGMIQKDIQVLSFYWTVTMRADKCSSKNNFVTGTDTGVGKTLLAASLLHHLQQSCCHALAMKPFCSGGSCGREIVAIGANG